MPKTTEAHRDPRPTLERPYDDPYLWLEEVDGPDALAWVEARNAETLARYGDAGFLRDCDIARDLLDRPDRIPFVERFGTWLYNFWTDGAHPRGLWRRVDEAGYRAAAPDWEILLDLDSLAATEGEDWVWDNAIILRGDLDRALVSFSRGGKDAIVVREFALDTRTFIADGFVLPEGKGGATWLDRDTVLLSSALGPGMATRSGYARTVRLWPRGTDPLDAPVLFETAETSMGVWGASDRQTGTERIMVVEQLGFFDAASISAIAAACTCASTCPPMPRFICIGTTWPCGRGGPGRWTVSPTPPTRCWRSRSPTCWRESAPSRSSGSRTSGAPSRVCSGRPGG